MRNFIGREEYLHHLNELWDLKKSRIACIYGRRRVGKTALIETFVEGKKAWLFEAIEGADTISQIRHFLYQLSPDFDTW
mgnify:FL=1